MGPVREGWRILGGRITAIQLISVCASVALVASASVFLGLTKPGRALRAVANDRELASTSGVDTRRVIMFTHASASGLAAVAGILSALDTNMLPTMGLRALMMGVVAAIIGGIGSISGIVAGALVLSMAQHLAAWKIGGQWQDAIAFAILLAFLLFRPQGFLGRKVQKAVV